MRPQINLSLRFDNHTVAHLRSAQYGICTLQYNRVGKSRLTEIGSTNKNTRGAPDTVKLPVPTGQRDWVYLTEPMQRWMFSIIMQRTPSLDIIRAKQYWKSLFAGQGVASRAFSDYGGSETNADYINGANLDEEPMKMKHIGCGGWWLHILGEDNRENIPSAECYKVEAIDPLSDFTKINWWEDLHLFIFPSISIRIPYLDKNGSQTGRYIEYVSEPFPHFNNLVVLPIWAQPGQNFVYVPKNRVTLSNTPKSPFRNTTERDAYHDYTSHNYPNPYEGLIK